MNDRHSNKKDLMVCKFQNLIRKKKLIRSSSYSSRKPNALYLSSRNLILSLSSFQKTNALFIFVLEKRIIDGIKLSILENLYAPHLSSRQILRSSSFYLENLYALYLSSRKLCTLYILVLENLCALYLSSKNLYTLYLSSRKLNALHLSSRKRIRSLSQTQKS